MTEEEYLVESARTVPTDFALHSDIVTEGEFATLLRSVTHVVAWTDRAKKSLIYGRAYNHASSIHSSLKYDRIDPDILHAILGIFTEAGELMEHLRDVLAGEPLDSVNIHEELGDLFWYIALLYRTVGGSPAADRERNIEKLRVRYPDLFDAARALNRNLVAERSVLEGGKSLGETGRD